MRDFTGARYVGGIWDAVAARNDDEAEAALTKEAGKTVVSLVWGQLLELHEHYEREVRDMEAGVPPPPPLPPPEEPGGRQGATAAGHGREDEEDGAGRGAAVDRILSVLDQRVRNIYDAAQPGTLFVVVTGQGNTAMYKHLQQRKYRGQKGLDGAPPWSLQAEEEMAALGERAACALCFASVK
jgi:hypothetical protein